MQMETQKTNHLTAEQIKNTGSVYTPSDIVDKLLRYATIEQLTNENYWFIEPCCGTGAIVIGILDKRYSLGVDADTCISHILCNDILKESIDVLKSNLYEWARMHNVKHPEIIEDRVFNMDIEMFFNIMRQGQSELDGFFD